MAYSVDWTTKVVTVPQSDLTLISPGVYELDVLEFWTEIHDIQDGEGMPYIDIMRSNAPVSLSGLTLARTVEIINGYRIEFEDGAYQVNLTGANNNLLDARVQNQVSINANNSAGLQVVDGGGASGGPCECPQDIDFAVSDERIHADVGAFQPRFALPEGIQTSLPAEVQIALPQAIDIEVACR